MVVAGSKRHAERSTYFKRLGASDSTWSAGCTALTPDMKNRGFSLLEVLVAITILSTAGLTLAHVFVVGASANRGARTTTVAVLLAQEKLEELRAATPGPSPPDSLRLDVPGYYDSLDGSGRSPGGVFSRRWSVDRLPGVAAYAVVIQVARRDASGPGLPLSRMATVKTWAPN